MPMTFPAHQGLILPVARRWPNSFDALALSVGAAMPDITDTLLGFSLNGYFRQWYGHSLIGIFTLDLLGGLLITGLISVLARRFSRNPVPFRHTPRGRARGRLWSFSVFVGILSHIGFDLISHDTNLLFYPWRENVRWFPDWWYVSWFEIRPLPMFGRSYSVGVFTILWGALTLLGIASFIRFLRPKARNRA